MICSRLHSAPSMHAPFDLGEPVVFSLGKFCLRAVCLVCPSQIHRGFMFRFAAQPARVTAARDNSPTAASERRWGNSHITRVRDRGLDAKLLQGHCRGNLRLFDPIDSAQVQAPQSIHRRKCCSVIRLGHSAIFDVRPNDEILQAQRDQAERQRASEHALEQRAKQRDVEQRGASETGVGVEQSIACDQLRLDESLFA